MSISLWVTVVIAWDLQVEAYFHGWTGLWLCCNFGEHRTDELLWYWFISGVSVTVKGSTVLVLDTRLALNPKPHKAKGVSCPVGV